MIIHQCFDSKLDDGSKINKLFINAPEFFSFLSILINTFMQIYDINPKFLNRYINKEYAYFFDYMKKFMDKLCLEFSNISLFGNIKFKYIEFVTCTDKYGSDDTINSKIYIYYDIIDSEKNKIKVIDYSYFYFSKKDIMNIYNILRFRDMKEDMSIALRIFQESQGLFGDRYKNIMLRFDSYFSKNRKIRYGVLRNIFYGSPSNDIMHISDTMELFSELLEKDS